MHFAPSPLRFAVILIALLCAGRALAQGTQGALPDPITTPELMRYADRLGLSDEQRRAAERLHDEYRKEFRILREGEIAAFLESMRSMQGTMPQRRSFDDFMRTWERLYGRIAQLDDRLFVRVQEILTEQQMVMLPRVRLARERARYSGGMQQMMMMGSPMIDLTTIVDALDMHPAERAAIDPALATYEHRLTAAMREMHKATNRMYSDMFEAFEQAGITEESMQDPEQMAGMMEQMQEVMQAMFTAIMERGRELGELNESAFRGMRLHLSAETGRAFRNVFYSQAYPGIDYALRLPVEAKLETAISLDQISEGLRESFEAMLADARFRADRVLEDAIELQKEQRAGFSPFAMEEFDWEEHNRRMSELHTATRDLDREVNQRFLAMLAEEVDEAAQQQVAQAVHEPVRPRGPRSPFAAVAAPPPADDEDRVARSPHDQYLPAAITRRELTIYGRMLDLDEGRTAVAEELHASYLERFEAMTQEKFKALAETRANMWSPDGNGADAASIERAHQLRRETLATIIAADESFFEDLALAVLEGDDELDRLERVRLARQREVYNARSTVSWDMFGRNANTIARIDVARLVRLASLPAQELERIDPVIAEYEREAAEAERHRYEASLALMEVQEKWNAEFMRARQDGQSQMEQGMRYQQDMREPQRRLSEASQRIAELNETTIAELLALLRGEQASKLDESYQRRAFPGIYNDSAAVDKQLTSAMRLPDLTEQQRSHLAELIGDYRPAYANLTEQMVEISRTSASDTPYMDFEADDWKRHMDLMEKMDRIRFERNELNARAISRIKSILNDTQLTALGPLPEPTEESGNMWGF